MNLFPEGRGVAKYFIGIFFWGDILVNGDVYMCSDKRKRPRSDSSRDNSSRVSLVIGFQKDSRFDVLSLVKSSERHWKISSLESVVLRHFLFPRYSNM